MDDLKLRGGEVFMFCLSLCILAACILPIYLVASACFFFFSYQFNILCFLPIKKKSLENVSWAVSLI